MNAADLRHPAVDAALRTAATLLGMEVVFISEIEGDTFTFSRLRGAPWPGIDEGTQACLADTFCARMLAGAPQHTADAERSPDYADTPTRVRLGVRSYVGVPIRAANGRVVGTLCGIDRGRVDVDDVAVGVLTELANIVAAHLDEAGPLGTQSEAGVTLRRTPRGWQVGGEDTDDLTTAMSLADLLARDLQPGPRPPRPAGELDDLARARLAVSQLEHALAARVVVEQAIGVLAERQRLAPRAAFDRLRRAARSRGRRVHELAQEVVASSADPAVPLPPELAGRRP